MKSHDEQRADALLADGLEELEARRQEPVINPADEAAAQESIERYVMQDAMQHEAELSELQLGWVIHLVDDEGYWPSVAVRDTATLHCLDKEAKIKLLDAFQSSPFYSNWADENGTDPMLETLRGAWAAE